MSDEARRKRIWVIDPSLQHAETEGVAEILDGWTGERRLFQPALVPGDGPIATSGYETDGVVLMGSRASVHDDTPWLRGLKEWLGPLLNGARPIPLLGICFGHQMIAHLAGARVEFTHPDRRKLVGVEESTLDRSRLLGAPGSLRVLVSHSEQVMDLPPGYRVIARRARVPIDGLEHEVLPVHSVQFHPEGREEFAGHAGIPKSAIDTRLRRDGRTLLAAFRDRVRASGNP